MNISNFENMEALSQKAAEFVLEEVRRNPESLLCTATGSSPKLLYQILAKEKQAHTALFEKVRVIPLDEWVGLSSPKGSCRAYLEDYVLRPLQISNERFFGFKEDAQSLEKECARIQVLLNNEGPIDVCVLGLGKNGHLGFNEPADELQSHCHIADLAPQSQEHSMIRSGTSKPTRGLTLGVEDILSAKKIILVVAGDGKEAVTIQLLSGEISNDCPATWLWKHGNVECLILNT